MRTDCRVGLKIDSDSQFLTVSLVKSPHPPLRFSTINPFLPLLPHSWATGVSPVWFRVWWSVRRRRPKDSTAPWPIRLASSATLCPTLNTRCSWLWPTTTLRVHPATRWSSPPRREVRTHPSQLKYYIRERLTSHVVSQKCSELKVAYSSVLFLQTRTHTVLKGHFESSM